MQGQAGERAVVDRLGESFPATTEVVLTCENGRIKVVCSPPVKWCPGHGAFHLADVFDENRARRDGKQVYCRVWMELMRKPGKSCL